MPLVAVTRFPPSVIFYTLLACLTLFDKQNCLGSCYQDNSTKIHLGKRMKGYFNIKKCNPLEEVEDNIDIKIVLPVLENRFY